MRILLTNDDGIMAEGIHTMAKELEKDYEVIIIAPESQRSAQSHAITLFQPLIINEVKLKNIKSKAYSISGTPADCVRAGINNLTDGPVDIVISGINMGLNAGMDILYSGTVSAAVEANINKLPSIAVSAEWINGKSNFKVAAKYVRDILEKTKDNLLKCNLVLNVNVPKLKEEEIKGIKICKIGGVVYDYYTMEENGDGDNTLNLQGREETELIKNTDRYYLSKGYVTLTPLQYDLTNFKLIEEVKSWI